MSSLLLYICICFFFHLNGVVTRTGLGSMVWLRHKLANRSTVGRQCTYNTYVISKVYNSAV